MGTGSWILSTETHLDKTNSYKNFLLLIHSNIPNIFRFLTTVSPTNEAAGG